jgi:hypothetical protein
MPVLQRPGEARIAAVQADTSAVSGKSIAVDVATFDGQFARRISTKFPRKAQASGYREDRIFCELETVFVGRRPDITWRERERLRGMCRMEKVFTC